jgi:hypothetical protein
MRRSFQYLVFLLAFCTSAPALAAGKQTMVYDVYASGIHVLTAQLDMDSAAGRYNIVLGARTYGFLASLVPWRGTFETHGWAAPLAPEIHKSHTVDSDGEQTKLFRYTKAGFKDLAVTDKKGKNKIREAPPELTKGTIDSLTATLKMLQGVAQGKECQGQSDIYDGKRRFTQVFHPQKPDTLPVTSYNIFSGPAGVCTVEVIPKGGAWAKKPRGWLSIQEQGRKAGALPTIWTAVLNKGRPAVPVKIMVKTAYGTLFLHLAEYRDGDKIVIAEKRK